MPTSDVFDGLAGQVGKEDLLGSSFPSTVVDATGVEAEAQGETVPLFGHAVRSLKWSYGASVLSLVLQLAYTATVSRLVAPKAFGLIALGGVLLRFIAYFAQFGLGSAVVQRAGLDDDDVRVAFTASTMMGIGAFGLAWLLAPVAAPLLSRDPALVTISRALSVTFILTGVSGTAQAVLSRALRFRVLAAVNLVAFVIGYLGVGLPLAIAGAGVWSLVGAALATSGVTAGALLWSARHPMRPLYDGARLRALASFGGMVSIIGFFEFIGVSLDTLSVGRFAGTTALGNYTRATALVTPVERLTTVTNAVLYPNFARVGADRERTAKAYLSGLAMLGTISVPPLACLAAAAPDVVSVVLGGSWHLAAGLLPPLALAIGIGIVTSFSGSISEALGLLRAKLVIQMIHIATVLIVIVVTVKRFDSSPLWFAFAWLIGEAVRQISYAILLQHVLRIPVRSTAQRFVEVSLMAFLPAMAMVLTRRALGLPPFLELIAETVAASLIFVAAWLALPNLTIRREIRERNLINTLFGKRTV